MMPKPSIFYNFTLFFFLLLISRAYAAPHPGTATSALTYHEKGLFFSNHGFQLGTAETSWVPQEDRSLNDTESGTSWRFTNLKNASAQAHLKIDALKTELTLEAYAKRWMKDYGPLGLDVLGTRTFASGTSRGIVIDLLRSKKKIQLRQAVFVKGKTVAILTCSSEREKFMATLPECNQLIKNFSWNDLSRQKAF